MDKLKDMPAFPTGRKFNIGTKDYIYESGITMRDYFAGQVLVGILYSAYINPHTDNNLSTAKRCYDLADAMLLERAKGENK